MFNILIIEDDIYQRKNLITVIKELRDKCGIFQADCKEDALKIADENEIDLFFVDLVLKNSSGLDFARMIRNNLRYRLKCIVFITAHINYMLEAFKEVHCYDYLIKPYDKEKIKEIITVFLKNKEDDNSRKMKKKYIILKSSSQEIKQYLDDIIFIEVYIRKIIVHTKSGEFWLNNISLSRIKKLINECNIFQSHRSYLINLDYIEKVDKTKAVWEVFFHNCSGSALISRNYKKDFEQVFKSY